MASSVWKGHITFGLITIPVRLLRAARSERVPLRELAASTRPALSSGDEPDPEPAAPPPAKGKGPVRIDRKSAQPEPSLPEPVFEPVRRMTAGVSSEPAREVTKGFEYEGGRYVTIHRDELRSITPATSPDMAITEFVHLNEIDPVYFDVSYYVQPEEAGRSPTPCSIKRCKKPVSRRSRSSPCTEGTALP
jgi:DNA end-binding protein Ku